MKTITDRFCPGTLGCGQLRERITNRGGQDSISDGLGMLGVCFDGIGVFQTKLESVRLLTGSDRNGPPTGLRRAIVPRLGQRRPFGPLLCAGPRTSPVSLGPEPQGEWNLSPAPSRPFKSPD